MTRTRPAVAASHDEPGTLPCTASDLKTMHDVTPDRRARVRGHHEWREWPRCPRAGTSGFPDRYGKGISRFRDPASGSPPPASIRVAGLNHNGNRSLLPDVHHEPLAASRDHGRETVVRTGAAAKLGRESDRIALTWEVAQREPWTVDRKTRAGSDTALALLNTP